MSKAWPRGLAESLRNPAATRAMGERGRTAVCEKFTWDVALAQVVPLYERVRREFASPKKAGMA
jgi:glycosyltransferase involved in cell wall biosynthesis